MKTQNKFNYRPMNKKGVSMSGFTEGILFSLLFALCLGIVITEMNIKYNKTYDPSFGLTTNETYNSYVGYQDSFKTASGEGEVTTTSTGMTLSSSWQLIKTGSTIIWDFVTGGWVERLVTLAGLPVIVGNIFRLLYFLAVGYIIIKIFFRVKP